MKTVSLIAGIAALFVSASVSAQDLAGTLKKIKETGTITIGHRESSIPFSYLDDKQQPIGYAMDLCMKVVDAVKAELKPTSTARTSPPPRAPPPCRCSRPTRRPRASM